MIDKINAIEEIVIDVDGNKTINVHLKYKYF